MVNPGSAGQGYLRKGCNGIFTCNTGVDPGVQRIIKGWGGVFDLLILPDYL